MNYLYVCVYKVPPQLILNVNATQFDVGNIQIQVKVQVLCNLSIAKGTKVLHKNGDNT